MDLGEVSAAQIVAMFGGMGTLAAAITSCILSLRNGSMLKADSKEKTDKLDQIHIMVDGNLSKAREEVKELKEYIGKFIDREKNIKDSQIEHNSAVDTQINDSSTGSVHAKKFVALDEHGVKFQVDIKEKS